MLDSRLSADTEENPLVRRLRRLLWVLGVALALTTGARAQLAAPPAVDAVSAEALQTLPLEHTRGAIHGTVLDEDGDEVAGAQVTLATVVPGEARKTVTNDDGHFQFSDVPAGDVKLTVTAESFGSVQATATVRPGEDLELPAIAFTTATAKMDVEVDFTRHDQAEAEIKDEETQRLAGFLPNFYVTYNWHAAPLSAGQKYKLAVRNIIDPANLLVNAGIAGVEQGTGSLNGYGQGAEGYFKRLGAANADFVVGSMIGGAILPALLHQDPRYFWKGTGSIHSRLLYALAAAVICRGDNGKWQPNYSSVLGDVAAGAVSNLYYPAAQRNGASLTIENGLLGVVSDAAGNVFQEFLLRKFTPHAPTYATP